MGGPVPRDLAFFIEKHVFPGLDPRLVEEALSCSKLLYLAEGEKLNVKGLLVVYSGSIVYRDVLYTVGDYVVAEGEVRGEKESVLIYFPGDCGRPILAGLAEAEACIVGELVHRAPVCVEPGTSCLDAVRIMARHGVSSILVCRDGDAIAIFTDTDLRRIIAQHGGVPSGVAVESCGTPSPLSVEPGATCIEAARVMMEHYVKHLVVREEGRVRGVVTVRDIAYAEALGPLYARRLLSAAETPDELRAAYRRMVRFLRRSLSRLSPSSAPGRAEHYARMASLALRSLVEHAAALAAGEAGVAGGAAYLAAGSLARQEQPLPTDRDTLLVYEPGRLSRREAEELAGKVEDLLDAVGFPGCSHGYTARRLVYSLDELGDRVRSLLRDPARGVVELGLLLDAVTIWPRGSRVGEELRRLIAENIEAEGAGPALRAALAAYRPRLGVLGRLPRRVDLKLDLLAPLAYAAKALHAASGMWREVNTAERILALAGEAVIPSDLAEDALHAYRVGLGYAAWSLAVTGARVLDTGQLSGHERQLLRAALQSAARLVDRARSPM